MPIWMRRFYYAKLQEVKAKENNATTAPPPAAVKPSRPNIKSRK